MRFKLLCVTAVSSLLLAACQPSPSSSTESATAAAAFAATCEQTVSRQLPFSNPDVPDTITIRTLSAPPLSATALEGDMSEGGALCHNATLVFTVHSGATGMPLYDYSMRLAQMDVQPIGPPSEVAEVLQGILTSAEVVTTEQAPALTEEDSVATTLTPQEYAAVVARKLPLLCFNSSVHERSCVFSDPDFSGQGELLAVQSNS